LKILVIGSGFLGKSIIRKIESEMHDVLVFSRTKNSDLKCRQLIGDIFDFQEFLALDLWKPEVIINTAWITHHDKYTNDASNYQYAKFAISLSNYALSMNVKHLIVLGSCAEYGYQKEKSCAGITSLNPLTLYAQQKVFAFNSIRNLLINSNTRFTWARIFYPYGPNQEKKRLLPYIFDSISSGELIKLKNTSAINDWITTSDIASAIDWIIKNDCPLEVDVGTGIGYSNIQIIEEIEKLLKINLYWEIHPEETLNQNGVSVVGTNSYLMQSGWRPNHSIHTGLKWAFNL
jgi:nucleoside-diphosphate-sugar epimerase